MTMFDFDKAFHKPIEIVPKDCPCRKCNEPKYRINNPYYITTKCEDCDEYRQWYERRKQNANRI